MAATQISICVDRQNRRLIAVGTSVSQLPDLSQRDAVSILIQIADPPTNSVNGSATILTTSDISSGKPRVTISQKATGTAADENTWLLAKLREADFTWDSAQKGFTGILNLNTSQLQDFIGSAESCIAEFEIRFSASGVLSTLLPGPKNKVTILANDDEGTDAAVDIINAIPTYTMFYLKDPDSNSIIALTNVAGVLTPVIISAP